MKTKEILETLQGMTMHESATVPAAWAQQLAKDLRIAVEALKYILQDSDSTGLTWDYANDALRVIEV